jgi:DNA modification methylase
MLTAKQFNDDVNHNAIIKNDMEFILMQRKPGGYRKPTQEQRKLSKIDKKDFNSWFRQIWNIPGASTRTHPAPFPLELASRLVRMFSFTSDTALDPFSGAGTTMIASVRYGRNSIGIDIDPEYCRMAARYLKKESSNLFINTELIFEKMISDHQSGKMQVCEDQALYKVRSARKIMN